MIKKINRNNALFIFSILLVICSFGFDIYTENSLTRKEIGKNNAITADIARYIEGIDLEMNKALTNAIMFVSEYMRSHPNMNRDELIKLKQFTDVATISIFDKNGYFYLTTSDALNPKNKLYDFYKKMSVLSKTFIQPNETVSTIIGAINAKNNPNKIITLPLHLTLPRNISNKVAVMYDSKLGKILDISYHDKKIDKILADSLSTNDGIMYATLKDANNNIISSHGNIMDNKGLITHTLPFAKKTATEIKNVATINSNDYYHYVLTVAFSRSLLDQQLTFVRITFFIITILIFIIIYFVNKAINQKDSIRLDLNK